MCKGSERGKKIANINNTNLISYFRVRHRDDNDWREYEALAASVSEGEKSRLFRCVPALCDVVAAHIHSLIDAKGSFTTDIWTSDVSPVSLLGLTAQWLDDHFVAEGLLYIYTARH